MGNRPEVMLGNRLLENRLMENQPMGTQPEAMLGNQLLENRLTVVPESRLMVVLGNQLMVLGNQLMVQGNLLMAALENRLTALENRLTALGNRRVVMLGNLPVTVSAIVPSFLTYFLKCAADPALLRLSALVAMCVCISV